MEHSADRTCRSAKPCHCLEDDHPNSPNRTNARGGGDRELPPTGWAIRCLRLESWTGTSRDSSMVWADIGTQISIILSRTHSHSQNDLRHPSSRFTGGRKRPFPRSLGLGICSPWDHPGRAGRIHLGYEAEPSRCVQERDSRRRRGRCRGPHRLLRRRPRLSR